MRSHAWNPPARQSRCGAEARGDKPATLCNFYLGNTLRARLPPASQKAFLLPSLLPFLTAPSNKLPFTGWLCAQPRQTTSCDLPQNELHGMPQLSSCPFCSSSAFTQYSSEASPSRGSNSVRSRGKRWVPTPATSVTLASTPPPRKWKEQTRRPPSQGCSQG